MQTKQQPLGMLKSINIRHFRGIRHAEIDGLERINVFLGNNNCGKSSVLEAVLILMGANNPALPLETNVNRNYSNVGGGDFEYFFHNCDTTKPIGISSRIDDGMSLQCSIAFDRTMLEAIHASEVNEQSLSSLQNYVLKQSYKYGTNTYESSLAYSMKDSKLSFQPPAEHAACKVAFYMAPRYNFNDYIRRFDQIVADKEKSNVVDALSAIEPRIKDIAVVGDKVMVDVGLDRMIPINLMGDGTRKLFTVVTALYNAKNGILIIDEIDNGLYFKSMEALWISVLFMARKYDIQVFLSTHSVDSLNALSSVLADETSESKSDVKIFTLRKNKNDEIKAYNYGFDKFSYLLGREEEIR